LTVEKRGWWGLLELSKKSQSLLVHKKARTRGPRPPVLTPNWERRKIRFTDAEKKRKQDKRGGGKLYVQKRVHGGQGWKM